jgi:hypothetical protein
MKKTKEITLLIRFELQEEDKECGIEEGYTLTDIINADTGKDAPDFSHQFYTELTEKLAN